MNQKQKEILEQKPSILQRSAPWLILLVVLAAVIWSALGINIDLAKLITGFTAIKKIISLMLPPDWSYLDRTLARMVQSIHISFLGTIIGSILAIPVSFIAANNILAYKFLSWFGRQTLNAIRTFPELILAVFFVASFGPGQLAGVMAIGIHSTGMLGKLYTDIIEDIDPGPIKAVQASGANKLEVLWYAVVPQVLPEFLATSIYRFEINMRASTVLGLVGAGGIGVILNQALNYRKWSVVGMALLVVIIGVSIIDYSSAYIRNKIV